MFKEPDQIEHMHSTHTHSTEPNQRKSMTTQNMVYKSACTKEEEKEVGGMVGASVRNVSMISRDAMTMTENM